MARSIAVFGASGFGREVMPLVRDHYLGSDLVFVDDNPQVSEVNGHSVLTYHDWLENSTDPGCVVAIADSRVRQRIEERLISDGVDLVSVFAKTSVKLDDVVIGPSHIVTGFVHFTSNLIVGRSFHANLYSYIAHDCVIGDYVTFAPRVMCNGNVHVRDYAYIGTGAILKQGTPDKPLVIGEGAGVGMGAVVTKDVAPGEVVVGNPAKPLQSR